MGVLDGWFLEEVFGFLVYVLLFGGFRRSRVLKVSGLGVGGCRVWVVVVDLCVLVG